MTTSAVLTRTRPRKLLALDGGGVRGILTVETLAAIEAMLQRELGRDDSFVLADYFDYIGGTSTGAIIGTLLALGMRVERIREFYLTSSRAMFAPAEWHERFRYKFRDDNLTHQLQEVIGADTTFGSDQLRTLLMLVLRNASTDSPWCLSNNPDALFNRVDSGSNLALPLWQLVRASTAAPSYFAPEVVRIGDHTHIFVDGGITTFNNPAFQLFLMATAEPYHLNWATGRDAMLLVSCGTGVPALANADLTPRQMNLLYQATAVPAALMNAANQEQDTLCRMFGDCRFGGAIDAELGDLRGVRGPVEPKLFTYVRYDTDLSRAGLDALGLSGMAPEPLAPLDAVERVGDLQGVGQALATQVIPAHFAGFLA